MTMFISGLDTVLCPTTAPVRYYPPMALVVICAVPIPVKTTPELSGPAFGVLPKTGDEELEDRGKPG